jgi:hypothetical protein
MPFAAFRPVNPASKALHELALSEIRESEIALAATVPRR